MSRIKLPFARRPQEGSRPAWRPIPAWQWTLVAAAAVVIVAVVVIIWLLSIAAYAKPGTDQANAKLDAVRTGLAAGAGAGAAVGLMLAFRRQHHQEIATVLTDLDATERRITELYTKAVEQLGSDKAPVRLGGLYALERLAQDNPAQRQTIVNVICAYLRMPFAAEASGNLPDAIYAEAANDAWQQERQVRLTAQRILADHLRIDWFQGQPAPGPVGPEFWPDIRLDLTGATLIDLNFYRVVAADATFTGTTFVGTAQFYDATFGNCSFRAAKFTQEAAFSRASFGGHADFSKATFGGKAGSARRPSPTTATSTMPVSAVTPYSTERTLTKPPSSSQRPFPVTPYSHGRPSMVVLGSLRLPSPSARRSAVRPFPAISSFRE